MGPNIVSLILNRDHDSKEYPYAATMLGDHEFPFDRIIKNQQLASLQEEMREWRNWLNSKEGTTARNRFLFKENNKFFETPYGLRCNVERSLVSEMEEWEAIQKTLDEVTFPSRRSDQVV